MSMPSRVFEHTAALKKAEEFIEHLGPSVLTRSMIAGSIRRGKRSVHDIEIVAEVHGYKLKLVMDELMTQKRLVFRFPLKNGPRYKALSFDGVALDLFMVLPDRQWGVTALIRTGPGEANKALVTRAHKGGLLPPGMEMFDAKLHYLGSEINTPDEESVFYACGMPYIEPHKRHELLYRKLQNLDAVVWEPRYPEQHEAYMQQALL